MLRPSCGRPSEQIRKEFANMKRYIVEHKHNGCQKPIVGNDFYHACKKWNCDPKFWKLVKEVKNPPYEKK